MNKLPYEVLGIIINYSLEIRDILNLRETNTYLRTFMDNYDDTRK